MATFSTSPVYRVNWLRAKARVERWSEESKFVPNEMRWTFNFYRKRRQEWEERARKSEEAGRIGHACYAWEQEDMWDQLAQDAKESFRTIIDIT